MKRKEILVFVWLDAKWAVFFERVQIELEAQHQRANPAVRLKNTCTELET